eukprot:3021371-Pleurochrysis_carterae.AAC.1
MRLEVLSDDRRKAIVTEGSRRRKIYASLTKCIFRQYTTNQLLCRNRPQREPLAKVITEEYYLALTET